jgi:general L-amino acid transport system permease protein
LWWFSGTTLSLEVPELKGFNFVGGMTLTPEFAALLFGLVIYTSGFIAEVVRSGIQSVGRGQWEAAGALGLKSTLVLRLVVLPLVQHPSQQWRKRLKKESIFQRR